MIKIILAYLPPVAWAALIFFLSSQSELPGVAFSVGDYIFKKSAHMFVYAVLYFLLYRAMSLTKVSHPKLALWPILFCFLYAITDEVHQAFTPGRHPSLLDLGYDMIGVSLASLNKNRLARFF